MRVDLEEVRDIMKRRKRINNIPLQEIEWFENGKKIEIDLDTIDDFLFTGLNNIDFITSGYYLSHT